MNATSVVSTGTSTPPARCAIASRAAELGA